MIQWLHFLILGNDLKYGKSTCGLQNVETNETNLICVAVDRKPCDLHP